MRQLLLALELARVIAGEAPGCEAEAKLAVAHVHNNRIQQGIIGGWFGSSTPTATDLAVALVWKEWTDPTGGALYLLGPGDLLRVYWVETATAHWDCGGTELTAWR